MLLHLEPKDFDIATEAKPEELLRLFPNSRLIGRRFPIVHIYIRRDFFVEVSTFRGREELDESQKENYGTPEEDAQRRDLTINALFYDPFSHQILDYVGGLEDLKRGIIRVIGEPKDRYIRDPVRMLRVIRHAARTGFSIEEKTWTELINHKGLIKKVPSERLRDELLKDLTGFWVYKWFQLMQKSGLLYEIYPFWQTLEENPLFSQEVLKKILKLLGKKNLIAEQKVVLYSYACLPLINKPYIPLAFKEMPSFDREELLKLFWALFFTFRYSRAFFEKAMDMLRDLYKIYYLSLKGREIPKRFRKKFYFKELLILLEVLERKLFNYPKGGKA